MKLSRVDRIKQTGASMIILKQYNSTDCNGYNDDTYDKDTGSDGDAKTNKNNDIILSSLAYLDLNRSLSIQTYSVGKVIFRYIHTYVAYPDICASISEQQFGASKDQFICKNTANPKLSKWLIPNVCRIMHQPIGYLIINNLHDLTS